MQETGRIFTSQGGKERIYNCKISKENVFRKREVRGLLSGRTLCTFSHGEETVRPSWSRVRAERALRARPEVNLIWHGFCLLGGLNNFLR